MKGKSFFYVWFLSGVLTFSVNAGIIYPNGPAGGKQLVSTNLDLGFLGVPRNRELQIADPCRIYGVGMTNLAAGKFLSMAISGTWHYLLMVGSNAVGAADVVADERTGRLRFDGLYQTDFSKETLEALRIAEKLPAVQKRDYEFRWLDCPGIAFVAVWLHAKSDDIILPLPTTFGRWLAYEPYTERAMLMLLKPAAQLSLSRNQGQP